VTTSAAQAFCNLSEFRLWLGAPHPYSGPESKEEKAMAFKPNYRQQRAERDRNARTKQAEKLQKLQEKSQQRKADRDRGDAPGQEGDLSESKTE
jgi:hypothetical protein